MKIRFPALRAIGMAGLFGVSIANAAQPAHPPFIVGVCAHLLHNGDASGMANQLIRDAGIRSVRADAYWSFFERSPGLLQIEPGLNTYLAGTERYGLDNMLILGYGNPYYGKGEKPRNDSVRKAFDRYVGFAADQLKGRVGFYEVWNEWDVEDPHDPQMTRDYAQLITASARSIRQRDPQSKILAGAVTTLGIESGFAQRLIENGIMQSVDGLSLHPYVHCRGRDRNTPEAWIEWMTDVDTGLSRIAGQPVPLYLTEMAWPAHEGNCGIDERLQAAYLARSYFLARTLPNIKGMWWYDFSNDGTDRTEQEHNFGLLRHDQSLKPAYQTLAAISEIVSQYDFRGRLEGPRKDIFLLRFSRDDEQVLVAWSSGNPRAVTVESSGNLAGNLQLIDTAQADRRRFSSHTRWTCSGPDDPCTASIDLDGFPKIISTGAFTPPR